MEFIGSESDYSGDEARGSGSDDFEEEDERDEPVEFDVFGGSDYVLLGQGSPAPGDCWAETTAFHYQTPYDGRQVSRDADEDESAELDAVVILPGDPAFDGW